MLFILNGELAGDRTQDPRLKRALLYLLSYELSPSAIYLDSIECSKHSCFATTSVSLPGATKCRHLLNPLPWEPKSP